MRAKTEIIIIVGLLIPANIFAAFEDKPTSARIAALGGAGTAIVNNSSELFYNPAAIALNEGLEFSAMDVKLYGIEGLKYNFFTLGIPPTKVGNFSLAYSRFGPLNYQEEILSLGYGFKFSGMALGILFNNMGLSITDAGSANVFGIDAGFLYKMGNKLSFGLSGKNINGAAFGQVRERIEQKYQMGIGWRFSENVLTSLDLLNYSNSREIYVRAGQELSFGWISFRAGLQFNPAIYSFGIGFGPEWLKIDYAYQTHSYLLSQNQFSLLVKIPLGLSRRRQLEEEGIIRTETLPEEEVVPLEVKETAAGETVAEKININVADEQQLIGVGFSEEVAKNIIRWRQRQGEFKQIEDVINVPGVFPDALDKVRDKITAEPTVAPAGQEKSEIVPEPEKEVIPEEITEEQIKPVKPQKTISTEKKTEQKITPEVRKSTETKKAVGAQSPKKTPQPVKKKK